MLLPGFLRFWLTFAGLAGVVVTTNSASNFATTHILVRFKADALGRLAGGPSPAQLARLLTALKLPPGTALRESALAKLVRRGELRNVRVERDEVDLQHFLYLDLPPGLEVDDAVRRVSTHPWVEYAEPDFMGTGGLIPNDPGFSSQWHHRNTTKPSAAIQTPLVWDVTQGSTNVLVAVLDTGLASGLSEFAGRTMPGYNFAYDRTDTTDDNGHGTAVAGTLCATGNNRTLVAGVDWRCRLMPIKVLNTNNFGYYSWWAQGIDFAVANGCKIINLSAGGGSSDATLSRSITNAIARGVIFVTITHNDGLPTIRFPGRLTNCITVGSTDSADRRASFSNYGSAIDLVAPGTDITTMNQFGALQAWAGTSFSAPCVAGVCALLVSVRPDLSHDDARTLLVAGADDEVGESTDTPGFDPYFGWGRLNAWNSLILARTRVERMTRTNNTIQFTWKSPANASNKQPYRIEFKAKLTDPWTVVTATNRFRYNPSRTWWTDDGSLTGDLDGNRFYRVSLRPF